MDFKILIKPQKLYINISPNQHNIGEQSQRTDSTQLQGLLKSYSNQNSVALVKE